MKKKDNDLFKEAKTRVRKKKDLLISTVVFSLIMIFLVVMAFIYTRDRMWWVLFPLAGFVFAFVIQYMELYGYGFLGLFDRNWEQEELEKEVKRLKYEKELKEYLENPENEMPEELKLRQIERLKSGEDLV